MSKTQAEYMAMPEINPYACARARQIYSRIMVGREDGEYREHLNKFKYQPVEERIAEVEANENP